MLIETHAHLDFPEYNNDREDVIRRANSAGVGVIINVSSSLAGSIASVELSKRYDCIYASLGIHPHDAKEANDDAIKKIRELALSYQKTVAIGEVGLDFYRNLSPKDIQYNAFVSFIRLSKELNLPLILHCREDAPGKNEASTLMFKALKENLDKPFKGVMHCFSGDEQLLKECLDCGLHISFTCNITYKKADRLKEVLKETPLERLLLETDSPFLAPQIYRGRRNEPAYIAHLADAISEIFNVSRQEIEDITTNNVNSLFNI
jgi:TatD DNase family protein